ncbi:hypothetical protein LJB88_03150 [Erysipelotrichaceae bacterium OttesenSCG-928-M19]|nr:hypothetical protein [Erysipelotrichaceae bacterium OttesenSCG-928-M19]
MHLLKSIVIYLDNSNTVTLNENSLVDGLSLNDHTTSSLVNYLKNKDFIETYNPKGNPKHKIINTHNITSINCHISDNIVGVESDPND